MKKPSSGFTLIELLVVIGIISVLTGLGVINFLQGRLVARDNERKSNLNILRGAIEQYRSDNGGYPYFFSGDYAASGWAQPSGLTGGIDADVTHGGIQMGLTTPISYVKQFSADPSGNSCGYLYFHSNTRQEYTLFAVLEDNVSVDSTSKKDNPIRNASTGFPPEAECYKSPGNADPDDFGEHCITFKMGAGTCSGTIYNYWINNPN